MGKHGSNRCGRYISKWKDCLMKSDISRNIDSLCVNVKNTITLMSMRITNKDARFGTLIKLIIIMSIMCKD